jgi:cytidylate kinase
MAIITISRGSYSKGMEVAEKVAQKLGYQCIAREILKDASKEFQVPELKLLEALRDAPSVLDRFTYNKESYVAYFQATLLKHLQRDNVVYHGFAGHFFLKGISHSLKVRIIADMKSRVSVEMAREGSTEEEALAKVKRNDEARRKWSLYLHGIDTSDPSLYDLVIHIGKISVDDAVDIICHCAALKTFETTFESQKAMDDLVVAAEVKASLIGLKPDIQVFSQNGRVVIGTKTSLLKEPDMVAKMEAMAKSIQGVKSVEMKVKHLVEWQD